MHTLTLDENWKTLFNVLLANCSPFPLGGAGRLVGGRGSSLGRGDR